MRIDQVAPFYAPVVGGIEDHVAALAKHAQAAGHDVVVHTLGQDAAGRRLAERQTIDGVSVRRWPAKIRLGYYTTRFEPRLEGDVAHLHAYGLWTHDWIARHVPKTPKVMTLQHGLVIPTRTPFDALYHAIHRRTVGRSTLRRMDRVVAINALDLERLARLGVPPERSRLIPNGVPQAAFGRAEPHRPPRGTDDYFLYVGRLHREKSVDHFLRALSRLPPSVGAYVAGPDHGSLALLQRLASDLGIAPRVEFLGVVPEAQKRSLFAGASALVLPSRYEAQGRVVLEAWAQRTPVVASRVGGLPFMVEHLADGWLYPWGDVAGLAEAMTSLRSDEALARRLASAGHAKAERDYREEDLFEKVLALYEDVAPPGVHV